MHAINEKREGSPFTNHNISFFIFPAGIISYYDTLFFCFFFYLNPPVIYFLNFFKNLVQQKVCLLPRDPGPCEALIPRWYYNSRVGKCLRFTYGGCQGNGNNFKTKRRCQRRCSRTPLCLLPAVTGPCRAAFRRWYYNAKLGKCVQFIYGGCQGNKNNFKTKKACQRRCPRRGCKSA